MQQSAPPRFAVTSPATGEELRSFEAHAPADVERALADAASAFPAWAERSFGERAAVLRGVAAGLRARKDELAGQMTDEMGKLRSEGLAEVEKCAHGCEYYAEHAAAMLADEPVPFDDGVEAFVAYNPLGPVLAVMPWNFPLWQAIRAAAPALMAGNVMLLKHASNVPGSAIALEELFRDAGAPPGVFTTLLIRSGPVAEIIADRRVAGVTLTGSVGAGRAVASAAGHALKPCVLELGGSDPYIVLEDADVGVAADILTRARMLNAGQSCIAGKRFIALKPVAEALEAALAERFRAFTLGDPHDPASRLGPMVSVEARDELHGQMQRSVAAGARCLAGGTVPDRPGAWYPATLLAGVEPGMAAFDEETFGPLGALIVADNEEHAIALANQSEFGLGGGVLTPDIDRGRRIAARRIISGMVVVNTNVRSDPRLPFGGVKDSGIGRELSVHGIRAFVNTKAVEVRPHRTAAG
jgi:succinate-semialdehyde dehydrogenase/glutarate-semialdehyde dehydrogenase